MADPANDLSNLHANASADGRGGTVSSAKIIDLFSRRSYAELEARRIVRIAPELDQLEMLYSNDANPERLFSMRLLGWGLTRGGQTVGLVPWLNDVHCCEEVQDPLNGHFEGYYHPLNKQIFYQAPEHKINELSNAHRFYAPNTSDDDPDSSLQEIPDTIGTHAVFTEDNFHSITLMEVFSWSLHRDGSIHGLVINDEDDPETPILPGDDCLISAQENPDYRYFFQHQIALKIKRRDPEAMAAIAQLCLD